jgi:hypothetical protein
MDIALRAGENKIDTQSWSVRVLRLLNSFFTEVR